jgi:type IV pilus assembly protein PilA
MTRNQKGFTLIELMIVVVIIGILAAIAIPNFIAMQDSAKEGSTKANMHTFQLAAEDYGVQNDGSYGANCAAITPALPAAGVNFKNPFDRTTGAGKSWADGTYATMNVTPPALTSAVSGITEYGANGAIAYVIGGYGKKAALTLLLTSGQ